MFLVKNREQKLMTKNYAHNNNINALQKFSIYDCLQSDLCKICRNYKLSYACLFSLPHSLHTSQTRNETYCTWWHFALKKKIHETKTMTKYENCWKMKENSHNSH